MKDFDHPSNWKYKSPETSGFHEVVNPENSALKLTSVFRLNLNKGEEFTLADNLLELNAVLVNGRMRLNYNGESAELNRKDSFYAPAGELIRLHATEDSILYIGGGPFEGKGRFFIRSFNPQNSPENISQVHGKTPFRRDVFMTLSQEDPGSRLICGITSGDPGAWTSWPPHQHSKDLEEVYFYFDIPSPAFALHLSSRKPGEVEYVHPVSSGDCVIIPEGYHPTTGMPGIKSTYFWIMAAHRPESRRYDLAVNDPEFS
jgi:5-deoxy-glucuronate isomerase